MEALYNVGTTSATLYIIADNDYMLRVRKDNVASVRRCTTLATANVVQRRATYDVGNVVQRQTASPSSVKNSKNNTAPGDARRQPEQRSASRAASATTGVAFRRGRRMGGYIRVRFGFRRPWSLRLRSRRFASGIRRSEPIYAVFTLENKCTIIALLTH